MTKFQRNNVHGRVAWRVFGAALMLVAFVFGSSSCVGDTIIRPYCEEGVNEGDELGIILILDS